MTEDEAKTKWCPFVRAPHLGTAGINRQVDEQPTPQARCIGSACMAWRWANPPVPPRVEDSETGTDTPRVKIKPPTNEKGWLAIKAGRDSPDKPGGPPWRWVAWQREIAGIPGDGYCGLAGKP